MAGQGTVTVALHTAPGRLEGVTLLIWCVYGLEKNCWNGSEYGCNHLLTNKVLPMPSSPPVFGLNDGESVAEQLPVVRSVGERMPWQYARHSF